MTDDEEGWTDISPFVYEVACRTRTADGETVKVFDDYETAEAFRQRTKLPNTWTITSRERDVSETKKKEEVALSGNALVPNTWEMWAVIPEDAGAVQHLTMHFTRAEALGDLGDDDGRVMRVECFLRK